MSPYESIGPNETGSESSQSSDEIALPIGILA
jgi:hypothetical protein